MKGVFLSLAAAALLPAAACGEKIDPIHEGSSCLQGEPVTWEKQAKSIFAQYCTRCHASSLGGAARNGALPTVNFDTYEGAAAAADRVDVRAGAGDTMPPSPPLPSQAERDVLHCWVSQGKKER